MKALQLLTAGDEGSLRARLPAQRLTLVTVRNSHRKLRVMNSLLADEETKAFSKSG